MNASSVAVPVSQLFWLIIPSLSQVLNEIQ